MLDGFDGAEQVVREHKASPRNAGAPGRLIIWHLSNRHSRIFSGLGHSRKIFLMARIQNADNLQRSCCVRGKPGSTSTIFLISPMTSWRPSDLDRWPNGPALRSALWDHDNATDHAVCSTFLHQQWVIFHSRLNNAKMPFWREGT